MITQLKPKGDIGEPISDTQSVSSFLSVFIALIFIGGPTLIITFPYFQEISSWLAIAICLTVVTIAHLSASYRTYLGVPHVIVLVSLLQLVLAAWWSYYYPLRAQDIGSNIDHYLSYSVPFTCALAFGFFLALIGLKPRSEEEIEQTKGDTEDQQKIGTILNAFIFGGCFLTIAIKYGPIPGSLHFLILLFSCLRYVGGLGVILVNAPNARYKVAFLILFELLLSTDSALFHHFILFIASIMVAILFRYRLGVIKSFLLIFAGVACLFALEYSKIELREEIAIAEENEKGTINQLISWTKHLSTGFYKVSTFSFDEKLCSHISTRFNQGWIVNLVLQHVPEQEPYAHGETIKNAVSASLLPRFLAPNKYTAGGRVYIQRFTGYTPSKQTSMNISLSGEFFANFGRNGAVIFTLFYAFCLGLIIRGFYILSKRHVLWWAFLPYIFFWTYKAEEGFGEILNWMSKSTVIVVAIVILIPTLRDQLWHGVQHDPKDEE